MISSVRFLILWVLFMACSSQTFAQITLHKHIVPKFESNFPKDSINSIRDKVQKALNDYNKYGTLFDNEANRVNATAIDSYRAMFNVGAEVLNELDEVPSIINASDYASIVFEKYRETGLKYEITSAVLDAVYYDSAGYFLTDVVIIKRVYNEIKGGSKKAVLTLNGRCYKETIKFDVPFVSNEVRIQKVIGELYPICPPKVTPRVVWIGPELRAGVSMLNFEAPSFLSDPQRTIYYNNLALEGGSSFGVGARLHYPLNTSQSMAFVFGLGYARSGLTASIDTLHYRFDHTDLDSDNYIHDARFSGLEEKITLSWLEMAPGISFRVINQSKFSLLADVQVLFRSISAKGEMNGDVSYSGIFGYWDWIAYGPKFDDDYGFTDYSITNTSVVYDKKFTAGIRLAPNMQYKVNNNMILTVGIEYDMLFGSPFPTDSDSVGNHILRFKGKQEKKTEGIGFNYLNNVRYSSLGIRIGLLYSLKNTLSNNKR